jgi:hypothetical protein
MPTRANSPIEVRDTPISARRSPISGKKPAGLIHRGLSVYAFNIMKERR